MWADSLVIVALGLGLLCLGVIGNREGKRRYDAERRERGGML